MDRDMLNLVLAGVGVLVPLLAFFWEFVVARRKRLGYRVQMDTMAPDDIGLGHTGILQQIQQDTGITLEHPSFVLVRIENDGVIPIDETDYQVLTDIKTGVRIRFPGRRVAGMMITELSHPKLQRNFAEHSGLSRSEETSIDHEVTGIIDLPRVPLNRNDHYKVLVVLDQIGPRANPTFEAGIKAGIAKESKAQTGLPKRAVIIGAFMTAIIVVLGLSIALRKDAQPPPVDCASGRLSLVGSTAFEPVMRDAAAHYAKTCTAASFDFDFQGSSSGLERLNANGTKAPMISFSDGTKGQNQPMLIQRPISFLVFALVAHKDAGVRDLDIEQIRRVYAGEVTNWKDLGGNDVPVTIVSRKPGSGTRNTFQNQILQGKREPATNSDNCTTRDPGGDQGVLRCERDTSSQLLDTVARTKGAIGYAELGEAKNRQRDLSLVSISKQDAVIQAAISGDYPFWETEYAYTYDRPVAESITASFLRYLTTQVGKDVIRSHEDASCDELPKPVLCKPVK
ncbi:phosphate ABC transporter substrate-binding protein [Pseudonocardiaceae bacterium YIM PH 21723]|nr:phosphate ABC transporter substrate-binding protein [Pseudonocardiaceae bacterium YIM PH 21723]